MPVAVSRTAVRLSCLVALLAAVAAAIGVFWSGGSGPRSFTTLHSQEVQLYGRGLYRYDSLQKGAIFRGTDLVTLLMAVPLLLWSVVQYRQGSLRAALLLSGVLGYFLYNSASLAFGAAYNALFSVYIALFSASLFAFVVAITSLKPADLADHVSDSLPHPAIGWFLSIAGAVLLIVWLGDIGTALVGRRVLPTLQSYTTEVTYVLDLGVLVPVLLLSGALVRRRAPVGYLLAAVMLVLNAIIGMVIVAQTLALQSVGVTLTSGRLAAYAGSFVIMSLVATWLAVILFRAIRE